MTKSKRLNILAIIHYQMKNQEWIEKEKTYDSWFHVTDAGRIFNFYCLSPLRTRKLLGFLCLPPSLVTDEIASSVEKMMNISGF